MTKLNKEEKEIIRSYEADEWQSVRQASKESERFQGYARETLKKDRRVNIRLTSRDLEAIQKRAIMEGIPYQTLIASILHKYIEGRLVEQ